MAWFPCLKNSLGVLEWEEMRALPMWREMASPEPLCENISYSIPRMKCAVLRNRWVWSQSWVCMHFLYFTEKLPRLCFESFDYVYIYTHTLIGFGNERAKPCLSWPDACCQISGRGCSQRRLQRWHPGRDGSTMCPTP